VRGVLLLGVIAAALAAVLWSTLGDRRLFGVWVVGLLMLTAPLEVYRTNIGPFNVSVFRIALVLAVCLLAPDVWRHRRGLSVPVPFAVYGLLLGIQTLSALFVSTNGTLAYRYLSQYLAGLVAAAVVVRFARGVDPRRLASLYVIGGLLPALGAAWRIFSRLHGGSASLPGLSLLPVDPTIAGARGDASFLLGGPQRMQGTFEDPNHFGFFCATVLVLAGGLLLASVMGRRSGEGSGRTAPVAISCATGALLLIGSYSRSGWLLAAVAFCLLGVLLKGQLRTLLATRRALTPALVAVLALGVVVVPSVAARVSDPGVSVSDSKHEQTMLLALKLALRHPLRGVGLGSYGRYADEPTLVSSSHSTFLTVAAEMGLPGLLALLAAVGTVIWFGLWAFRREPPGARKTMLAAVLAAYAGLAVANVAYEVWYDDFQWVLFGFAVALFDPPALVLRRAGWLRWHPRLESPRASPW
jgi:O-antigen ligase